MRKNNKRGCEKKLNVNKKCPDDILTMRCEKIIKKQKGVIKLNS